MEFMYTLIIGGDIVTDEGTIKATDETAAERHLIHEILPVSAWDQYVIQEKKTQ